MNEDLIASPLKLSEPEEDPLLSPGREVLIQTVKDAHQFDEEEDDFKDARDTADDGIVPLFEKKGGKSGKKVDDQKKKKEDREVERKEEKKKLEEEF